MGQVTGQSNFYLTPNKGSIAKFIPNNKHTHKHAHKVGESIWWIKFTWERECWHFTSH